MFLEGKSQDLPKGRFDAWARKHPGWMTMLLVLLAIATAAGLLFQRGYSFVLYQGF